MPLYTASEQLNRWIEYTQRSTLLNEGSVNKTAAVSEPGARVVRDVKKVLEQIKRLNETKNKDDKIQKFLCEEDTTSAVNININGSAPSVTDQLKAAQTVRTLGRLLMTDEEFNQVISDMANSIADLTAEAIDVAANKAKAPLNRHDPNGTSFDGGPLVDEPTDVLVDRIKRIITSVQDKKEYHDAINALFQVAERYRVSLEQASQQSAQSTLSSISDSHLRRIIEAFAGGKSLDPLFNAFVEMAEDTRRDEKLRKYIDDVMRTMRRVLKQKGYVTSSAFSRHVSELQERGQHVLRDNSVTKGHAQNLAYLMQDYLRAMREDAETQALLQSLQALGTDVQQLTQQVRSGQLGGLLDDLFDVWIPRLVQSIQQIPLPKIEFKSPDYDVVIDGINLEASGVSFIPDKVQIVNSNKFQFLNGYAAYATTMDNHLTLRVEGVRVKAKDVAFYVFRKNAFFHRRDWGLLTFDAGQQQGMTIHIELERAHDFDRQTAFKVKDVRVDVNSLNLQVSQTHHPVSNFFFSRMVRPALKSVVGYLLQEHIANGLQSLDKQFFAAQQRAQAVAQYGQQTQFSLVGFLRSLFAAQGPPTIGTIRKGRTGDWLLAIGADQSILDVQPGPKGWAERHKRQLEEAKRKIDALTRGLPAGVAQESDRIAAGSGGDWRSDAFDIPM